MEGRRRGLQTRDRARPAGVLTGADPAVQVLRFRRLVRLLNRKQDMVRTERLVR